MSNVRGGKKRHSSQPLEGDAKDSRTENNAADIPSWSQVTSRGRGTATLNRFSLLSQACSYPDRTMRSESICSRGSRGSRGSRRGATHDNTRQGASSAHGNDHEGSELTYSESSLGEASRFVTPQPDGAFRDDFAIEFQQINGRPFKGTITLKEARDRIFRDILGFNPSMLHSIRPVFGGVPTIRFKLKEQIDIDCMASVEYFELERIVNPTRTDVISCRVMGVRGLQAAPNYDGTANDVRWIKVENCEYAVPNEKIVQWLSLYGQPLSLLGEDKYPDSDSEAGPLGNGTYSIKMKLVKDVPQFLPMHGRKIRIYFKNMTKLCTNCYGHHSRRQCTNRKVPWIVYVRDFMMENPDITEDFYGKWWDAVDEEFPGYFDQEQQVENLPQREDVTNPENQHRQEESQTQNHSTQNAENPDRSNQNSRKLPPTTNQRRRSRDPRLYVPQHEQDELVVLMERGLTMLDAKNYMKNKKEQQLLEQRMSGPSLAQTASGSNIQDRTRGNTANIGPGSGSSRWGRGGLTFN